MPAKPSVPKPLRCAFCANMSGNAERCPVCGEYTLPAAD